MNQQAKNRELALAVYQNIDAHAFDRAVELVSPVEHRGDFDTAGLMQQLTQ